MTIDTRRTVEQQVAQHNAGEPIYLGDIETFVDELIAALEVSWAEHDVTKEELENANKDIHRLMTEEE